MLDLDLLNNLELLNINIDIFFLLLTFSFFSLAVGLKFIDEAYDGLTFDKKKANLIAPLITLISIITMALDSIATVILSAYVISISLQKKLDLKIYKISLFIFLVLFFWLGLYNNLAGNLPILIAYIIFTFLDEQGNKIADHYFLHKDIKISPIFAIFMKFRLFIITGTIMLYWFGAINYLYIFPILAWVIGYNLVIIISENRKKSKKKQLVIVNL